MPNSFSYLHWRWLSVVWLLFTSILLCIPGNALPATNLPAIPYFDKYVHLFLYAIFSFLVVKSIPEAAIPVKFGFVSLVILHGIALEYVQKYLIPLRSFDVFDIAADSLGALLGYFISKIGRRKIKSV